MNTTTHANLFADSATVVDRAKPEGIGDAYESVLFQLPQPIQQLLRRIPGVVEAIKVTVVMGA